MANPFSRTAAFIRANRAFFLTLLLIVIGAFAYRWYQLGFALDFSRFFAAAPPGDCGPVPQSEWTCGDGDCDDDGFRNPSVRGNDCDDGNTCILGSASCRICQVPSGEQTCGDGDCDDDGRRNPSVGGDDCDDGNWCIGGGCGPSPTATPTATPAYTCTLTSSNFCTTYPGGCPPGTQGASGTCPNNERCCRPVSVPSPTTPPPTTPPPTTAPCPAGYQDWGAASDRPNEHFCWRISDSSTLSTAACQPARNGPMCQTWQVVNNTSDNWYDIFIGFHDPVRGCSATTFSPSGGLSGHGVNFAPGARGSVTVCYDGNRHDCGRIQLDGCWKNARTGECRNRTGDLAIGAVIDYGRTCATPTPTTPPPTTITPPPTTITPPPTTITPPPTTITPPPTTITPPPIRLSCAASVAQASVNQRVTFTGQGGNGTYEWFSPGGRIEPPMTSTTTPYVVSYDTPGLKTVTMSDLIQTAPGTYVVEQAACTVTIVAPQEELACRPQSQDVISGQPATVQASGGMLQYSWSAPGGNPPSARSGTSFTTTFTHAESSPRAFPVTVTDANGRTATCSVNVSCAPQPCPAPPDGCSYQGGDRCSCGTLVCPSTAPLVCAPASQTVQTGQNANFVAGGGTSRTFLWSAPNGDPSSAGGPNQSFSTRYRSAGSYTVTVTAGTQTASCAVLVQTTPPPTTVTPPPTAPGLSISKSVRNVTASDSDDDNVSASPGQTIEFTLRISSTGTGPALGVTVRDSLPAGLTYQAGTTTIDGTAAADGITGSGLVLGDVAAGRTVVVRFRATVAPESFFSPGLTVLLNTAWARAANAPEVSDNAAVTVERGQGLSLSLTKTGRNSTRGETGENATVHASPGQTVEFVLRVRNTTATALSGVLVRDVVPQGITLVGGSVRLNGTSASDALTSSGLQVGTLAPGAEAVVTFSGRLASADGFPVGTTTLINTAQASAGGVPLLQAQATVVVTRDGTPAEVPTGPGESALLALIISGIITLLYVGYTSTEAFRRREAASLAKEAREDRGLLNFRR